MVLESKNKESESSRGSQISKPALAQTADFLMMSGDKSSSSSGSAKSLESSASQEINKSVSSASLKPQKWVMPQEEIDQALELAKRAPTGMASLAIVLRVA